jgi:hypothetical protein
LLCELELLHLLLKFESAYESNVVMPLLVVQELLELGLDPGARVNLAPDLHINLILLLLPKPQGVVVPDLPFRVGQGWIILVGNSLEVFPGEFFDLMYITNMTSKGS